MPNRRPSRSVSAMAASRTSPETKFGSAGSQSHALSGVSTTVGVGPSGSRARRIVLPQHQISPRAACLDHALVHIDVIVSHAHVGKTLFEFFPACAPVQIAHRPKRPYGLIGIFYNVATHA